MRRIQMLRLVSLFIVIASVTARGAEEPRPPTKSQTAKPVDVTRADLAAAYLRLERAVLSVPPEGERLRTVNQRFDRATTAFFLGRNAEAIREIDELTHSLSLPGADPAQQVLYSLKVSPEPPTWRLDDDRAPSIRVQTVYKSDLRAPRELELNIDLRNPAGQIAVTVPLKITLDGIQPLDRLVELPKGRVPLTPGQYQFEVRTSAGPDITVGRVNVVPSSLDAQREQHDRQLSELKVGSPELERALATCRARNQLLTDEPSPASSIQFLADLHAFSGEIRAEINAIAARSNPYSQRLGDIWRPVSNGKREVPTRIYVPQTVRLGKPLPLLIVLHGMGGDENMFFEAYGAGVVKQLAEQHGLLVAAPLTYTFGSDIRSVEGLIDALSQDYNVDRNRVYVLGHSLGAGATASLARGNADTIAAACCIAGGSFSKASNTPPLLVVIPELDGVVPPARVRSSAEAALAAGVPIEILSLPDYGHTLAVGAVLPKAVEWLLTHARPNDADMD